MTGEIDDTYVEEFHEERHQDGTLEHVSLKMRVEFFNGEKIEAGGGWDWSTSFWMKAYADADGENLKVMSFRENGEDVFRRHAFPVFWEMVGEFEDRGFYPDTGPLERGGSE